MREDVINLQLRDADVREIYAGTALSAKEVLSRSVDESSHTWVIKHDNNIIGVFGVNCNFTTKSGVVWLLGTQGLDKIKLTFTKYSPLVIDRMLFIDGIDVIFNYVSVYHEEAIKWLKWCGFEFMGSEVYMMSPDIPFVQFYKWRDNINV